MLSLIGKSLQILGLLLLPLAMAMQLTDSLGRRFYLSHMVIMAAFGVVAFTVGWILRGRPS